jgi:F0F1-type ATP synthase assembly protein I
MDQRNETPNPKDSGVSGTQEKGEVRQGVVEALPPLNRLALHDTFIGLTASRPRNFGGDFNATLIGGMIDHFSQESIEAKQALKEKNQELSNKIEELSSAKIEIATLKEKLGAAAGLSRVKQTCTFIGTAVLGVAVDLYKNNFSISYLVGIIGVVLIGMTLFVDRKEK